MLESKLKAPDPISLGEDYGEGSSYRLLRQFAKF